MRDCLFEQHEDGTWHCTREADGCCWGPVDNPSTHRNCAADDPTAWCHGGEHKAPWPAKMPGLGKRVVSWCSAVARWKAAGSPVRPIEEVERIYATICSPCDKINSDKTACTVCGCRVNAGKTAMTNKIRMTTESCPLEKW